MFWFNFKYLAAEILNKCLQRQCGVSHPKGDCKHEFVQTPFYGGKEPLLPRFFT